MPGRLHLRRPADALHPLRRVRRLWRLRAGVPGRGDRLRRRRARAWAQFTGENAKFFDQLSSAPPAAPPRPARCPTTPTTSPATSPAGNATCPCVRYRIVAASAVARAAPLGVGDRHAVPAGSSTSPTL